MMSTEETTSLLTDVLAEVRAVRTLLERIVPAAPVAGVHVPAQPIKPPKEPYWRGKDRGLSREESAQFYGPDSELD